MDRTTEFLSAVAAAGGGARAAAAAAYGDGGSSAFTRAAAQVGRDLHATAAKVEQLTKSAEARARGGGGGARARARRPAHPPLPSSGAAARRLRPVGRRGRGAL